MHLHDDGTVSKEEGFNHGVILCGWVLDGIGRVKLAKSGAYSAAIMACQFCGMTGISCCGFTRQLGYLETIKPKQGKCTGMDIQMGVNDAARLYSAAEQKDRAIETERELVLGK